MMNVQHLGSPAQAMDLGGWFRVLQQVKARLQAAAVQDPLVLPTEYADLYCVRQDDSVHVIVLDEFGDQAHVHEENEGWTVSEHEASIVMPLSDDLSEQEISYGLAHLLPLRLKERWMPMEAMEMALAA